MSTQMMACGHASNAVSNGKPACAICNVTTIAKDAVDLSNRQARCSYYKNCKSSSPSSKDLAFFGYKPDREFDNYYCGCMGWD